MAARKKSTKKKTPSAPKRVTPAAAEEKFKSDLLIRGEAATADASGNLPLEATHEIVEKGTDTATTKIVRRRFKLY
jgi:hypothetical protein